MGHPGNNDPSNSTPLRSNQPQYNDPSILELCSNLGRPFYICSLTHQCTPSLTLGSSLTRSLMSSIPTSIPTPPMSGVWMIPSPSIACTSAGNPSLLQFFLISSNLPTLPDPGMGRAKMTAANWLSGWSREREPTLQKCRTVHDFPNHCTYFEFSNNYAPAASACCIKQFCPSANSMC